LIAVSPGSGKRPYARTADPSVIVYVIKTSFPSIWLARFVVIVPVVKHDTPDTISVPVNGRKKVEVPATGTTASAPCDAVRLAVIPLDVTPPLVISVPLNVPLTAGTAVAVNAVGVLMFTGQGLPPAVVTAVYVPLQVAAPLAGTVPFTTICVLYPTGSTS
jgi:hypothetical protein